MHAIPKIPNRPIKLFYKMFKVVLLCILISLSLFKTAPAQNDALRLEPVHVPLTQDVPVPTILQDSYGFIWFGTWGGGFYKYDGYDFKGYNTLTTSVLALYEDTQKNTLWIGTDGQGWLKFDLTTEEYGYYRHDPDNPQSVSHNTVNVIMKDAKEEVLWIGTNGGLNKFDLKTETFEHYSKDSHKLISDIITCMYQEQSGVLWIGTDQGVNQFDPVTGKFSYYQYSPPAEVKNRGVDELRLERIKKQNTYILSIRADQDNNLWIGTIGGLNRLDQATRTFIYYPYTLEATQEWNPYPVHVIHEDQEGNFWLGTKGGVRRFYPDTKTFALPQHPIDASETLGNDVVTSIFEDRSGILWIGTAEARVYKVFPIPKDFVYYQHNPDNPKSLSHDVVNAIYEDREGTIWVGTKRGLDKIDRKTSRVTSYRSDPENPQSLGDDNVQCIYEDQEGTLWIGTKHRGLNKFDRSTETFTYYYHSFTLSKSSLEKLKNEGIPDEILEKLQRLKDHEFFRESTLLETLQEVIAPTQIDKYKQLILKHARDPYTLDKQNTFNDNDIRVIYEEPKGTLWIGTGGGGLNKFDLAAGKFTYYTHDPENPNSISHNDVITISQDQNGNFWIGTREGLNKFNPQTKRFTRYQHDPDNPESLSHNTITALSEDDNNMLWIGTSGGGLNKFDHTSEKFTTFGEQDDWANKPIYGILQDNDGNLWLSTTKGLSKFNLQTHTFRDYTEHDGLPIHEFNVNASHKSQNGELLFGGNRGLIAFYPAKVKVNSHIPPVVLTGFKVLTEPKYLEYPPTYEIKDIRLSFKDSLFSLEFAALDYTNPEKNAYKLKLEGHDQDWIPLGTTRSVDYPFLWAGNYVFRVRGANNDGIWNEDGLAITITIEPSWWQTWWAKVLLGIVIIPAIALPIFIYTYIKFQQKAKNQAEQVAKKLRAVNEIGWHLTSDIRLSKQEILELIHEQADPLMDTKNMYIALYDENRQMLSFVLEYKDGNRTKKSQLPKSRLIQKGESKGGLTERVIQTKASLHIPNLPEWLKERNIELPHAKPSPKSWVGVPLIIEDKVLGIIALWNNTVENIYGQDDLEVLQAMAGQAAVAIENVGLYKNLDSKVNDLKEANKKIAETQNVLTKSGIADDFIHRINNLAGTIRIWTQLINRELDLSDTKDRKISKFVSKIDENTRNLLSKAAQLNAPLYPEDIDLKILIDILLRQIEMQYTKIHAKTHLQSDLYEVHTVYSNLEDAIWNVVLNGIEAMPDGGTLTLTAFNKDADDRKWVQVMVEDDGHGISSADKEKIFRAFYSTKDSGRGYGLWRSKNIIESLGGRIEVESKPGIGSQFMIMLPVNDKKSGDI